MEVGRALFGSVILSFLLSLFGPLPVKYLSGNGLYYFSCTPLRFDSSVSSLEVITDHKQVNSTRRYIGFRLRGKGYFGSRVNYHHNSTSSFQLIRLIKCGDVSLNPGPTAIQVVIGNRHSTNGDFAYAAGTRAPPCLRNLDNIIVAKRQQVLEHIKNDTRQLLLCVLNARSLRNKSATFVDLVCDSKADLFAVSETWLTDNDTAILSEITPQGYTPHHCPRSDRREGGTALIFKESINVEKVSVAGKGSFETSEWLVNPAATTRLRVVIVYRPPHSVKHAVSTSTFITEFSDYLESLVMSSEPLLILGDFNIHMDLPDDTDCRNMSDLLVSMGLKQHVLQPTHERGHTLDSIITRISDNIIAGRPFTGELFSDHFPVFCQLKPERPLVTVKHLQFRKIKSIDRDQFSEAICSSQLCLEPPDDLDTLVNCYNETLRSVLDIYTPVLTRDIIVRPRAPWFNEDIRKDKHTRRRAEKKWRTTRLPADLAAFKKERNRVVNLMNEARRVYYNQFIKDNSTDQRRLFMASKNLLNMQPDRSLPPHIDVSLLANDMGEFFITKIANIRSKLDGISPSHLPSTSEPDLASEPDDIVLSDFQCQTVEAIRDMPDHIREEKILHPRSNTSDSVICMP
ncbi:uncharacterized protein [Montipora foliosa]|uniref:uncharacterized protein n=1 Tax=Montipora foliosa TaxID=591990 RepID=UPI0035F0FEB2